MNANILPSAVLLALLVALAGCSKSQPTPAADSAATDTAAQPADTAATETQAAAAAMDVSTNAGGAFAAKSEASPFATSDLALKESYNRALIANQIGDYARAVSELQDLAANTELNAEQRRAVQELLAQVQAADPAAVSNLASMPKAEPPVEFAAAQLPAGQSAQTADDDTVFSTADPAVRESFARAKAAHTIGNYSSALSELQDLSTNSHLNAQQKYAVQTLLDKTPQNVPGVASPK